MIMKDYKYRISVVIPVYNVEKYLSETLDSVIAQSIGFEENIQIILVNDGSPDDSEAICLEYRDRYPDNIVYVVKENGGVSSARNAGIPYIEGKYVNFLDSDDKWTRNSFKNGLDFFDMHYDEIDVVGARKKFFDAEYGYHKLDYKFKKTKLVDLTDEYEFIQMDVTGAFIKAEAIGDIRFCEDLKYGEDARFINTIIIEKRKIGVCRTAVQLYRKRTDESSALQNELKSESYYFNTPKYLHQFMIDLSVKKYGRIEQYIQFMIMYDISWRLKKNIREYLDDEQYEKYCKIICDIIEQLDDRVIFKQKELFMSQKMFCLCKKHGRDIRYDLEYDHGNLLYKNLIAMNLNKAKTNVIWYFTEIKGDKLILEGRDNCWLPDDLYKYYAKVGDETYYPTYYDSPLFDQETIFGVMNKGRGIRLEIPLVKGEQMMIRFYFYFKGNERLIYTTMGKFAHIPPVWGGYYVKGDYMLRLSGKCFAIYPYSKELHKKFEDFYCEKLRFKGKGYLLKHRKLSRLLRSFNKGKKIWLISDRTNKANDNGEHMFRYIVEHAGPDIEPMYVIDKNCPDYQKMKRIGKVLPYNTPKYRLYFLIADKIISSAGGEYVINAYGGDRKYMCDLYDFDYVFLQHGVTKDDISGWINRYNKNMKLIVTAGKPEQRSFCDPHYAYPPDVPVLTGFPRHDNLIHLQKKKPVEKKILIIPTWRKSIKGSYNPSTTESIYFDGFKETEYFNFYNSLINDERLCSCMKEYGYTGLLCMHPIHSTQWVDFHPNEVFHINHGNVDYQNEFVSSALLVTDYSSVFFDFGFLRKPVVYCQFDREEFFEEHSYDEGYFSYEENGFGPVCYDLDSTVDSIIASIKNDCKNTKEYVDRIEDFYGFDDDNSCKRVYESILRLDDDK